MNQQYIYNITFHCDANSSADVRYYLERKLLPTWQDYPFWQSGRLLRLHQIGEVEVGDEMSFALQFASSSLRSLQDFMPSEDPCVQRIAEAYGSRVTYTDTILEVLE